MERKIAIVTCSNATLDYIEHDYDIKVFRSSLILGDEEYLDYTEITADEFYQKLENDKNIFPRTAMMPTGKMVEIYEELAQEGYTDVIVITISSEMSGLSQTSQLAAKEVPQLNTVVFDSKTVVYSQAYMVLTAAKMAKEKKSVEEIIAQLKKIQANDKIYVAVNTLDYFVKNGRLSNSNAFFGNLMKIKPLLEIGDDGKVVSVEKIRTFRKALSRMLERIVEDIQGYNAVVFICHANNYEVAEELKAKLLEVRPDIKEVVSIPLSPVIGAHGGPKTVSMGYIKLDALI